MSQTQDQNNLERQRIKDLAFGRDASETPARQENLDPRPLPVFELLPRSTTRPHDIEITPHQRILNSFGSPTFMPSPAALTAVVAHWLSQCESLGRREIEALLEVAGRAGIEPPATLSDNPRVVIARETVRESGETRRLKHFYEDFEPGPEIDICSIAGMAPGKIGPAETIVRALCATGINAFIGISPDEDSVVGVRWKVFYGS